MKKHLYLLIATLAITLLSADAMVQKKDNNSTRKYFHITPPLEYTYNVVGEIDSMRITYHNVTDIEKVTSTKRVTENKQQHILNIDYN